MKAFIRQRWPLASTVLALFMVVAAGWIAWVPQSLPSVTAVPSLSTLPGAEMWNEGASSLLFGTNDSYEWSTSNLETQPAIQQLLRSAGFTLVRTFIPDKASDATLEQRISTIEHIGGRCLAVLTNINDTSFDEHVVSYLGNRCQLYEFGNEPDYTGISSDDYVAAWNATIPLLRHINPLARFIGPVTSTAQGVNNFLQHFLEGVKTSTILPDAVSFHFYPCYKDDESSCLAKATTYQDAVLGVRRLVKQILGKELPVGITEWNYDPGNPPPPYGDNASFITKFSTTAIKSMIAGGAAFACQFDAASYGGYGRLDMFNVTSGQAKPQYYALAALIKHYNPASSASTSATTAPQAPPSTLLSHNAPMFCSANDTGPNEPSSLTDGKFGNWGFWQLATNALPGWCAIQLRVKASSVLFAWYSDYSFDYTDNTSLAPQDYDLAVSSNSTNGNDGAWQTVLSIRGNHARAREHVFGFAGMSWIKMTVLDAQPKPSQPYIRIDELEVFDAQKLGNDTFFFSGDSITAMAYNRYAGNLPAFADDVQSCASQNYPLMMDGGFGGQTSDGAVQGIASWQTMLPDMHYWLLGWGTNDALDTVSQATFRANLQAVVAAILQKGDVPVLAHIPYATYHNLPGLNSEIQQLNQVIDQVTAANHLIPGPDFYKEFQAHPAYLGADGLHPSGAGAAAMNALWLQTLRSQLGLTTTQCG